MKTGQIGDTIGGITSPFINGLGALLVYLAFKEQRVANEITKRQQQITHIENQINRLEDSAPKIRDVAVGIDMGYMQTLQNPDNINQERHVISNSVNRHLINEATYLTAVFEDCVNQCDLVGNDAQYLRNRIGTGLTQPVVFQAPEGSYPEGDMSVVTNCWIVTKPRRGDTRMLPGQMSPSGYDPSGAFASLISQLLPTYRPPGTTPAGLENLVSA